MCLYGAIGEFEGSAPIVDHIFNFMEVSGNMKVRSTTGYRCVDDFKAFFES